MSDPPAKADPEIAAVTFDRHLTEFFGTGRPAREEGWERITVDPLHTVIRMPATRSDGTRDAFLVLTGAEFYDLWPPSVAFVEPVMRPDGKTTYRETTDGTRWWPRQNNAPGFEFGLHAAYPYPDGVQRQLLCFSQSLDYYYGHTPTEAQRWLQGHHTVGATLTRIADILKAPNYQGPSSGDDT